MALSDVTCYANEYSYDLITKSSKAMRNSIIILVGLFPLVNCIAQSDFVILKNQQTINELILTMKAQNIFCLRQGKSRIGKTPYSSKTWLISKNSKGADIQVWGSSKLIQLLLKHDLVDELRLKIHPLTLGKGKKLFDTGLIPASFKLIESDITSTGVIIASYKRPDSYGIEKSKRVTQEIKGYKS
jgi:RibD C-terminal domain